MFVITLCDNRKTMVLATIYLIKVSNRVYPVVFHSQSDDDDEEPESCLEDSKLELADTQALQILIECYL